MSRRARKTGPGTRRNGRARVSRLSSLCPLPLDNRRTLTRRRSIVVLPNRLGPRSSSIALRGVFPYPKGQDGLRPTGGYDGSVSQLTPRVDPNEPPELPRDFRDYEPVQPRGTDWKEIGRKIWAPFAAIGAFIAKFGVGILKYKFLLGLFISFGAYLWFGGIWFAVGLIGLIFVHEMGHWLEAKRQGLPVTAPLFIPFLGASIFLKEHPESA